MVQPFASRLAALGAAVTRRLATAWGVVPGLPAGFDFVYTNRPIVGPGSMPGREITALIQTAALDASVTRDSTLHVYGDSTLTTVIGEYLVKRRVDNVHTGQSFLELEEPTQ